MLVRERMQALGDHAKSSRQPPLKERKSARADESAATQDTIDETILENSATHDNAAAVIVDEVTSQAVVHESGNGAVAEIASDEDAKRAIFHEWENWSALHSDELEDPNVGEYFFQHLEMKKTHLLNFGSEDEHQIFRKWIIAIIKKRCQNAPPHA
jgi:hypothetical protein